MKIAKNYLKKLDDRSKCVVHLGIEKGIETWRVLDTDTGTIYVRRNLVFEEEKMWPWEKAKKKLKCQVLRSRYRALT